MGAGKPGRKNGTGNGVDNGGTYTAPALVNKAAVEQRFSQATVDIVVHSVIQMKMT
jgi:hypothetical protein